MDFNNIKETLKNNYIERQKKENSIDFEATKQGDQYRSFVKQIDNIIEKIASNKPPFDILPLEILSEDIIVSAIEQYLKHNKESRLAMHNINNPSKLYNYHKLFYFEDQEAKQSTEMIYSTSDYLKKGQELNHNWLLEELDGFSKIMHNSIIEDYSEHFIYCAHIIKYDINELLNCILACKFMGLQTANYMEIQQLIYFIDTAIRDFILFFVIENPNVTDKKSVLKNFQKKLLQKQQKNNEYANILRKDTIINNHSISKNDKIIYFIQSLTLNNYYSIQQEISNILIENARKLDADSIEYPNPNLVIQEYINQLANTVKIPNKEKRIQEFKDFVKIVERSNFKTKYDRYYKKALFYELCIDKCSYKRKQALTIFREILEGFKVETEQLLFLDMKIEIGIFKMFNALDEYEIYMKIVELIRNYLLKTFYIMHYNHECEYLNELYEILANHLFYSIFKQKNT